MVVIADKAGQLGNRLMVASHLLAAAIENGFRLAAPSLDEYARYFPLLTEDPFIRLPPRRSVLLANASTRRLVYWAAKGIAAVIARLGLSSSGVVGLIRIPFHERVSPSDPSFVDRARTTRLLMVQGWLFRNPDAVSRQRDRIIRVFEPVEEVRDEVARTVAGAKGDAEVLVGVHIRQGDYSWHLGGRFFFSSSEYARHMSSVVELFPGRKVRFLVCSNEPQSEEIFEGLDVTLGHGHVMVDLYSLARCDYLLGAPSSFTIWASYYGRVPLYLVVDPMTRPALDGFRIAPDIRQDVGSLF